MTMEKMEIHVLCLIWCQKANSEMKVRRYEYMGKRQSRQAIDTPRNKTHTKIMCVVL